MIRTIAYRQGMKMMRRRIISPGFAKREVDRRYRLGRRLYEWGLGFRSWRDTKLPMA